MWTTGSLTLLETSGPVQGLLDFFIPELTWKGTRKETNPLLR